jgi:hypothetical protein
VTSPPTLPPRLTLSGVIAALPDLGLSAVFLGTWIAPHLLGVDRIGHLLLVMLLEFIVVHSAGFMGVAALTDNPKRSRAKSILGLGAFYTLFVGGFALGFKTWWPLVAFWGLTLNRLLSAIVGQRPRGEAERIVRNGWVMGAIAYIGALFITTPLPLPRLGVTSDVVAAAHLPGHGLWIDQPHRVLAAGFLYFLVVGISELFEYRFISDVSPSDLPKGRRRS